MYQSEALWLNFQTGYDPERGVSYPFAVKVAAGKINAVTGKPWAEGLSGAPQDYLVGGVQPWLDGYCVDKGFIRQFVAMPLGAGVSVEEQLTGEAEHGGLQLLVYPMKREIYEQRFPIRRAEETVYLCAGADPFCAPSKASKAARTRGGAAPDMGLAAGGRMRQELHEDPYELSDWQLETKSRAFVHLANSLVWRGITDEEPPTTPPTAKDYKRAGLPWFEHYSDKPALGGSKLLAGVKSVAEFIKSTGQALLPENESVTPTNIVELNKPKNPDEVREGDF